MFKKNSHNFFCYCPACRTKRKISVLHNIIISALALITLYQSIITILDFSRIHCLLLLLELVLFTFFVTRTLF